MFFSLAQVGSLFTAPALAAAGLAAVAVPIAIHLLWRLRRRPEPWGAMRFLLEAYRRHRSRMRLEQWLLLANRCLILAVLGLALSGPLLAGFTSLVGDRLDAAGRDVHIVLDDSLSTRAHAGDDATRFERLRDLAHQLVTATAPRDRVSLWIGSRPARRVAGPARGQRGELLTTIAALEPGYARSDIPAALRDIHDALAGDDVPPSRADVIILSDLPRAADYLDDAPGQSLRDLAQRAHLVAARPAPGVENIQIAAVRPHRRLVLADRAAPGVGVEIELRRFDRAAAEARVNLVLELLDDDGQPLAQQRREQRLAANQHTVTVNLSLPIDRDRLLEPGEPGRMLALRARVESASQSTALVDDDARYALFELRRSLAVGLVTDAPRRPADGDLAPVQWLTLALAPFDAGPPSIEIRAIDPRDLQSSALDELDAAIVLRPDSLGDAAWAELAGYARGGGVVWVFPPAEPVAPAWAASLRSAFELDWQFASELAELAPDVERWRVDTETAAPAPLRLLAPDWASLLRPVRVSRHLPIGVASEGERWIALAAAPAGDDAPRAAPALLAGRDVGRGVIIVAAVSPTTSWTNLPTRPAFVALVHETLRGVLGDARAGRALEAVAGDRPALDEPWTGVDRLARLTAEPDDADALLVREREGERTLDAPLRRPGVYRPDAANGPLRLVVNVDADAGDTLAAGEQRVEGWLNGMGAWAWLDEEHPGALFAREPERVNLGWPLLWVVLVLVVMETLLARWFSHAPAAASASAGVAAAGRRAWAGLVGARKRGRAA